MEVSQITDLDTHVVIGGGMAQAFSMSDSAEFFTVLSDTLYRDKKRAVVREVICNAWDAHVMGNCTDKPVEITLTDTELVIRDFGPGIHDDRIVPIYCVYGASTKVKDDKQTGGFGLGSKAPFAYSDHFTVTSCHAGTRSVYAISRGSAATDGKPDIRRMVSVSTLDSGITVSIPLGDVEDRGEFEAHIRAVVRQGGIKARLNEQDLLTFDYSLARQTGMGVVRSDHTLNEAFAYVLYGTVLYPLNTTDGGINKLLHALAGLEEFNSRMVLVAPPGSVGVTPSRESLSFTTRTTQTITRLLERAIAVLKNYRHLGIKHLEAKVAEKLSLFETDLRTSNQLRNVLNTFPEGGVIADPEEIGMRASAVRFLHSDNQVAKSLLQMRVGMRKFRDHRRTYRRWLGRSKRPDRTRKARSINDQVFSIEARLYVRIASKLGLLQNLCLLDTDLLTRRFTSVDGRRELHYREYYNRDKVERAKLIIAPTRVAIKDWGIANDVQGRRHIGLAIKRPTEVQLMQIRALAERYKIEVVVVEAVKKEPKPKKPKPEPVAEKFYSAGSVCRTSRGRDALHDSAQPELVDPKYFVGGHEAASRDSLKLPTGNAWRLSQAYPGTAVAFSAIDAKRLADLGLKDVVSVVIDELEAVGSRRDALFVVAVRDALLNPEHSHLSRFADWLGRQDLQIAKLIYGVPVTITADTERFEDVLKIAEELNPIGENAMRLHKALCKLRTDAKEAMKKFKLTDGQIRFLQPLYSLYGNHIGDTEAVRAMISALKTHHRRKHAPSTTTNLLKEAA